MQQQTFYYEKNVAVTYTAALDPDRQNKITLSMLPQVFAVILHTMILFFFLMKM